MYHIYIYIHHRLLTPAATAAHTSFVYISREEGFRISKLLFQDVGPSAVATLDRFRLVHLYDICRIAVTIQQQNKYVQRANNQIKRKKEKKKEGGKAQTRGIKREIKKEQKRKERKERKKEGWGYTAVRIYI